ncbi:MAG: hypothetical protein KDD51_08565, partial [Bdellovibrionales bacterium]|nr:hypothetical protein [Bdellovibrionales bacterium]
MRDRLDKDCTVYIYNSRKLEGGRCQYDAGIAGHCIRDWDSAGKQHDASLLTSLRLGEVSDVKFRLYPDFKKKEDIATAKDVGSVGFTADCDESNRRIPVWALAEKDKLPAVGAICMVLTQKGFIVGVVKDDPAAKEPMLYLDTKPFAGVVGADQEPDFSQSGSGLLCDNRIVATCVGIPARREKKGFYCSGGLSLGWMRNQKGATK